MFINLTPKDQTFWTTTFYKSIDDNVSKYKLIRENSCYKKMCSSHSIFINELFVDEAVGNR